MFAPEKEQIREATQVILQQFINSLHLEDDKVCSVWSKYATRKVNKLNGKYLPRKVYQKWEREEFPNEVIGAWKIIKENN